MIGLPPTAPCRAQLLFAQMRDATGGATWNRTGEVTAYGSVAISGLKGTARLNDDLRHGRYAQRFDVAVMGASAEVYDGRTVWSQDISGGVHPLDAPFPQARAVTSAYLTRRGYFDSNAGATFTCLGTSNDDGRPVVLVRVRPRGGTPAVLAIDARSHLLTSISERLPLTTLVTRYADYRQVDGLALPFIIESGTKAEPGDGFSVVVRRYELTALPHAGDFARPILRNPPRMFGNATSTTVPMTIEGRQLLVWASIDGRESMPFILDTGGHAILTTLAAKMLGLHASGAGESGGSGAGTIALQYTRVRSLRIGRAELRDQRFLVIPYPYSFYERARKIPLAGILGLEIFERFAVRINYGRSRVTLTPFPSDTAHHRSGFAVPIRFQEDMPLTQAAADGYGGWFGVDTGNAGSLILFGTYLQRTHLIDAYPSGLLVQGHGTGGSNTGRLVTLRRFTIAGRTFARVVADFTNMKSGSFSSWSEAGNFGYDILARFVPTFDYQNGMLSLASDPLARAPKRNRSGMAADKSEASAFDVVAVKPGSPAAAAGIVVGDRIVAIDGKDATEFSRADLYDMTTEPPGTRLRLRILRGRTITNVTLTLH